MPIYEYRCDKGHEVEVMQSMSEDALTECPDCGAPARRVLHSPAIHFKGSGFHNTDYGTRSANKAKQAAHERWPTACGHTSRAWVRSMLPARQPSRASPLPAQAPNRLLILRSTRPVRQTTASWGSSGCAVHDDA